MQTNLADFTKYKQKFDTLVVYIGDTIEWQDYDGQSYEAVVRRIEFRDNYGSISQNCECFPLWEKNEYVIYLSEGMSVLGDTVVRKLINKSEQKAKASYGGLS